MLVLVNALQAGNRSGTGQYVRQLARHLPRHKSLFDFVFLWPEGLEPPAGQALEHEALLYCDVHHPLKRIYMDQVAIHGIRRQMGANIIHYPASVGNLFGIHNPVLTVHDLSFLRHPAWFPRSRAAYLRRAVARSARLATRVIADSEATAADLTGQLALPAQRIDVIPLGVEERFQPQDEEAHRAVRTKYGLPEVFFLYVGTLEPRKNLDRLVRAWTATAGSHDIDLVLAGRPGWRTERLQAALRACPYPGRLHRPGFIADADLPALFSAAHAFLWPSLWEGFGLPPLEAMACGTPVLTSNTSSLPEVVGDAALCIDPTDEAALADAIGQLARDDRLRASLCGRGRKRAAAFPWDRTAQETIACYRRVLNLS